MSIDHILKTVKDLDIHKVQSPVFINKPLVGCWYRVIQHDQKSLIINPHGIETPNVECVYIHKKAIELTEDMAKVIPECHAEWQLMVENNRLADEEKAAGKYQRLPQTCIGFLIDIENNQRGLYFWDAEGSQELTYDGNGQDHYLMRRLDG